MSTKSYDEPKKKDTEDKPKPISSEEMLRKRDELSEDIEDVLKKGLKTYGPDEPEPR